MREEEPIGGLTPRQRAHLRSLAHHLKPVLHIGQEGVTDGSVASLGEAFRTRELLKIRVREAAPEGTRRSGELLAARIDGAQLIQVIGRVAVLYRPHPEAPEIDLPD